MPARVSIVAILLVCLLFVGQAAPSPAPPSAAVEHGCAMMNCDGGCCESADCCAALAQQAPQEKSATTPAHDGLDAAIFRLYGAPILRWSPPAAPAYTAVARIAPAPARPRLAVSCIHLI
jgi:hypothetical protein